MTDKDPWRRIHPKNTNRDSPPRRHQPRSGRTVWRRLLWWLISLAGLFILANWLFPGVTISSAGQVLTIATLVVIGSVIVISLRLHYKEFFRYVALWSGIILVLATAYAFRHDIAQIADRIAGSASVSRGYVQEDARGEAMVFERGRDGHFHIRASIGDKQVHFLVDTGATNVVLTRKDAEKLGIRPKADQFFERYYTANGVIMAAPVILESITIGDTIHMNNVRASVSEGQLGVSLLGMSFLNRLASIEISGERLILKQ